ncbi:uridine kinase [Marinoscillum sp. 108]|jgi:uridine kinase|uniref:uridine kinase n=1 Tax=Marinoscillum sp. 108 TaxID=2653151 RepID=UPI0012F28A4F|nr:uridine kinase [Marinoscillum sp. 108]VXD20979.1 Uridine kinase [Marinoscillum sp. 108]
MSKPLIIGITGGSGSGKTLFLKQLMEKFEEGEISLLSLDNYYKPRTEQPLDERGVENFDLPESLDRERFSNDLRKLKQGEDIIIQEYTFNNDEKKPQTIHIKATPIIVVEGIFTFYYEEILDLLDLKIYIEAPDYLMLTRRITRDAEERGYDLSDVLYRFQHHVTPAFKKYIEPLKHEADVLIPNHNGFSVGLEVIVSYLRQKVNQ